MRAELFWGAGLLALVIVTAMLINRFARVHRARLRRLVYLFLFYAVLVGVAWLVEHFIDDTKWGGYVLDAARLIRGLVFVNAGGTLLFSLALPAAGMRPPRIVGELVVGLAYVVATLGFFAQHGLDPGSALVSGAVVSAVLAVSLQGTLGNLLGGVALQLDGSIHEGDWIEMADGRQGRVRAVRWRHTVVETRDFSTVIVPNSLLLQGNITILGRRDGAAAFQRMWVWFNVDFRYPPAKVIDVVERALLASPIDNVAAEPAPNVVCMDFSMQNRESFASYAARYWIIDLATDEATSSRIRSRVFAALKRANIPLAVPATTAFVEIRNQDRDERRRERELEARLGALRTVALFKSLTEAELHTLAEGMSPTFNTAGETITRQGAQAHWLYVMTAGRAEIRTHDEDGVAHVVSTLSSPDFFGEMSLMTGEPRSADVVATTDVECFRLGKATFEKVLLARPEIATELSEKLTSRRMELLAVHEGLDARGRDQRRASERERILDNITRFFGL